MVGLRYRKIRRNQMMLALRLLILASCVSTVLWKLDWKFDLNKDEKLQIFDHLHDNKIEDSLAIKNIMTIVSIACGAGNRSELVVNMMKSAMILSNISINFVVFSDNETSISVMDLIKKWPKYVLDRMRLDIRPINFPPNTTEEFMNRPFQPCAAQKLFFPVNQRYIK